MRQENEGKIDSVTLYQDRACVARVTEVEFETGNHSLTMSSLPGGTMENSIRVRGHGSTPITLHKVNISTSVMASEPDEKVRDLESKTIDAAQEQKLIELKLDARKKQVEFVDKLAKAKTDSSSREIAAAAPASRISVEELGQIADFIYDRRVAAEQDQMALARDLEVARKKFQALQWELKKAKGDTGSRKRKTVTIDFSASEGGKASFTVEYMVSGASWRPLYNVRATAEGGDTQVSYMAMVRQVTGEDWSDVNLKLSTAMPSRGAKAPEVKPWDVDILKETPIHYLADGQAGGVARGMILGQAEELYESLDDSDVGMAAAATTVKSSGVSTTFSSIRRETVPSGGDETEVTIAELHFGTERKFVSAPRLSPYVYLQSTFENSSDYPLLAGQTNVFLDDDFLGEGSIKTIAPGQKVDLDLGIDEGFRIEHKLVRTETGKEGIILKRPTVWMAYAIELESYKKSPQTVELTDHLPLPKDSEILLKQEYFETKPDERDDRNIVKWKILIEPKEKKTIRIEFSLEYPKDKILVGLDL